MLRYLLLTLGRRLEVDSLCHDSCKNVGEHDALCDVWLVHQTHAVFHPKLSIGENQRRQAVDDEFPQIVVLERDAVLLYQNS